MKLLGLLLLEMLAGFAAEMESGGSITIEHLFGLTGVRVEHLFGDRCHTSGA